MTKILPLQIRAARRQDLRALALVYQSVFSAAAFKEKWPLKQAEKRLSQLFASPDTLAWTARVYGQPVGFAFLVLKQGHDGFYGELAESGVHPYFQKQGIGRALLMAVKAARKQKKLKNLYSLVYQGTCERFLEKNGFKPSERSLVFSLAR